MGSSLRLGVIGVALVACGGKKDEAGPGKDRDVPIRIAFSDCTSSPVPFVSGPRPLPLQTDDGETTARDDARTGLLRTAGSGRGGPFASLTGTGDPSSGVDDSSIYGRLLGDDDAAAAGLGGSGMRGRRNVPTTSLGQPNAAGDLDKAVIRRYIRRNLQKIAGADDVVYGDVVKAIDLATKVGFTDWKVLPGAGLAARPAL